MATPTLETSGSNSGVVGTSGTVTVNLTLTNATMLLLKIGIGAGSADPISEILSQTWNGTSVPIVSGSKATDGSFEGTAIYKLDSPAAGAHSVVVTNGSGTSQIFVSASAWIGAGALTLGSASIANNTTANPSVTCADSANGDVVVSIVSNDEGGVVTQAGTTLGEVEGLSSDSTMSAQYQTATGANTVCSWTEGGSGASWAASAVAIKDAGGGGGGGGGRVPRGTLLGAG